MATESGAEIKKEKKPNFFVRIGRWFRDAGRELRKTTWPKGRDVFKKLGTVLIVVLFFFLILLGMDLLLGYAYDALTSGIAAEETGGTVASFMTDMFRGLAASGGSGL